MTTMTAPSTPPAAPRKSRRVRTPPGPQHGSYHNDWEPHGSPRRSTRSSLASNPYSTSNTTSMNAAVPERGPSNGVPPLRTPHARKSSFWQLSDLISPPTSPNQLEVKKKNNSNFGMTPRKQSHKSTNNHAEASSNAPSSPNNDAYTTFSLKSPVDSPFDTKPVRKATHTNGMKDTARILRFQPADPNDCFPTKKQTLKQRKHDAHRLNNFEVDVGSSRGMDMRNGVNIYTDMHARVPQLDDSEENVFYRPSTRSRARTHPQPRLQSSSSPDDSPVRRVPTAQQLSDAREMQRAVENGEGTIQMFRGRKIFHRFDDVPADSHHISKSLSQRTLRHAAGAAADRPMTRSSIQPRLLFPVSAEEAETDIDEDNIEDETDVEVHAEEDVEMSDAPHREMVPATPAKGKGRAKPLMLETPPTTGRTTRVKQIDDDLPAGNALTYDETLDAMGAGPAVFPGSSNRKKSQRFALVEIAGDDGDDELDNRNDGLMRPPPTPARRTAARKQESTMSLADNAEDQQLGSLPSTSRRSGSLFDHWPRTKSGGQKRGGDAMTSPVSKRTTRSARNGEETSA